MADYLVKEESLIAVADAIREKTGETAELSFPEDYIIKINDLANASDEIPSNGKEWIQSNISNITFNCVYNANNLWVAGTDEGIYYSEDGKTWTKSSSLSSSSIYSIYYGNGIWVAATDMSLCYSENGKDWTRSPDSIETHNDVYYAEGYWVSVADDDMIHYSTDGKNWEESYLITSTYESCMGSNLGTIRYGDGMWVAISKECNYSNPKYRTLLYTTTNSSPEHFLGIGEPNTSGYYNNTSFDDGETLNDIYYANGAWVAASPVTTNGLYHIVLGNHNSNITITKCTIDVPSGFNCVYNANDLWVAGSIGNGLYYSQDGITWIQSPMNTSSFTSIYYENFMWVAGSTEGIYYSTDGINWAQSTGITSSVKDVYCDGGIWVAGTDSDGLYYSNSWTSAMREVYESISDGDEVNY